MTKFKILTLLRSFVWMLGTLYKSGVKDLIKDLESPNMDIIVWNDISVPMPENGKYLISNGEETNTMHAVQINGDVNHELHWVNKQCRKKYIKWAKMPEYKI